MTTSSTSPPSSASAPVALGATPVRARWTGRAQGDQRRLGEGPPRPPVPPGRGVRRLTQVHGADVLVVGECPSGVGLRPWAPTPGGAPPAGDALVATGTDTCLAVLTADCASVALGSAEGVHAAVHAGWRGLLAGVVQQAVSAMRLLGAGEVVAAVGPLIHPCCYEFSAPELDAVAARYGDAVRGRTSDGRPALDLPATVALALHEAGVAPPMRAGGCTGCGPDAFSHRRRGDEARQALLVWRAAPG